MSLERSKFYTGPRGYGTNVYLSAMGLGAGEGASIIAAAGARCNTLTRQHNEASKLPEKRRATVVCLEDPVKKNKVVGAGVAKKPLASPATGNNRATSSVKRATKITGETTPKKAMATTTLIHHKFPAGHARQQQINSVLNGSMPGKKRQGAGGKKQTTRANRGSRSPTGQSVTKWLLLPQSNFRTSSESSSEAGSNQVKMKTSYQQMQHLRVKTSWPEMAGNKLKQQQQPNELRSQRSGQSRIFSVPGQRILLTDELRQAQIERVLPKAARLQRQQQQIMSKSLLLQTDDVRQSGSVNNSSRTNARQATATKCKSQSSENCSNSSDYPTSVGSSGIWNNGRSYETPIVRQNGGNKSVKLTSTVIKILPETSTPDKPNETAKAPTVVAASKQLSVRHSLQQQQPTQRQPLQQQKQQQLQQEKQVQQEQQQQQQCIQRQPLPKASKQKQQSKLRLSKQKQQQDKQQQQQDKLQQQQLQNQQTRQQQKQESPQQQQPRPTNQLRHQLKPTATTSTIVSKIVCVEQHKVPRTVEDGIDISYQYFVSKPVARGRKVLPIRYLYRPMMRRLNASTTKRSKKSQSESKTDDHTGGSPCSSVGSSDVETESDEELEAKSDMLSPPPLVVDAKYLPLLKELNKHPMPQDVQRQRYLPELRALKLQLEEQSLQQQQQLLTHTKQQQQWLQQKRWVQQQQAKQQQQYAELQRQQAIQAEHQQLLAGKGEPENFVRPKLIDFQPNVTRLGDVGGASICFHAPIRMSAGGGTETATIAGVTYNTERPGSCSCCCRKSVSFQLENINNMNNNSGNSCSTSISNSCSSGNYNRYSCSSNSLNNNNRSAKRRKYRGRNQRK